MTPPSLSQDDLKACGELCDIRSHETVYSAVKRVVEERDAWKEKYLQQNRDLGCELRDPNGTIWDHCKLVMAERDELRREIKRLRCGGQP